MGRDKNLIEKFLIFIRIIRNKTAIWLASYAEELFYK